MTVSEIKPLDWLHWHSGRVAQDHAIRLCAACSAVLPSDNGLRELLDEQIRTDLIGLAIHGRRTMERRDDKSATFTRDPLWPPSSVQMPDGVNLWDAFGVIIHAVKLTVEWEKLDFDPNPYKGRDPRFAGSVQVESAEKTLRLPIGAIVAAFVIFMNMPANQPKKEAD